MAQQITQHVARKVPGLSILISKTDSVQRCSHILNISYATLTPFLSLKFGHSVNLQSPKRQAIYIAGSGKQSKPHLLLTATVGILCPLRQVNADICQCYLQKSLNSLWTS